MTFFPGKFKPDLLQIYLLVYANFGGWNVSVKLLNMSCPEEYVYTLYTVDRISSLRFEVAIPINLEIFLLEVR